MHVNNVEMASSPAAPGRKERALAGRQSGKGCACLLTNCVIEDNESCSTCAILRVLS